MIKSGDKIAVEMPIGNQEVMLLLGQLVERTSESILLTEAAFVKDTGRRTEFFAGRFDSDCEIEVYPDNMQIEIPAHGCILYLWIHDLPRLAQ
jgi:hypothetical protein